MRQRLVLSSFKFSAGRVRFCRARRLRSARRFRLSFLPGAFGSPLRGVCVAFCLFHDCMKAVRFSSCMAPYAVFLSSSRNFARRVRSRCILEHWPSRDICARVPRLLRLNRPQSLRTETDISITTWPGSTTFPIRGAFGGFLPARR